MNMTATNTTDEAASLLGAFTRPVVSRPVVVVPFRQSLSGSWDRYVQGHSRGTLFHGMGWKRAVERTFGHRFLGLVAMKQDAIVGVLPLYEVRSILAGRLLISVPYATYGGILADTSDIAAALFSEAKYLCVRVGARSVELRSIEAGVPSLPIHATHATFTRALPGVGGSADAMLPRKARAAARRAADRQTLTCEFDNTAMPEIWHLYARSMRRLGSPNYPLKFFEEIGGALSDSHLCQIVRSEGKPIAGLLSFLYRGALMPYFVGLDERADVYGLSHYLYARSMQWGIDHGYRVYDFGRSRVDNTGPFEFKRLCGFEPTLLQYQTFTSPGCTAPDLSPASTKWSAARRVWKSLPLTVTRPLGSWLAKSIPG